MKKSIAGLVLSTILFCTCQDAPEKTLEEPSLTENFNATVGERIPVEVAERWLENYNKSHNQRTKENSIIYGVSPAQLNMILKSNPVGIVLHHAIDGSGTHHIILIPIDKSLRLWPNITRTLLDTNTGKTIDASSAQTWTKNYQNIYPNNVRSHFFGVNIFKEIATIPRFNQLEIIPAFNDKGIPQLVLFARSSNGEVTGRTQGEGDGSYYDASVLCSPNCLTN